jgi:nicotinamidase-related amidase
MLKEIFDDSNSAQDAPAAPAKTLAQRVKGICEFFDPDPQKLADILAQYEDGIGLVIIDLQKEFCDPKARDGSEATDRVAESIAALAPEFRKFARIYAVGWPEDPAAAIDFYKFHPEPQDTVIVKTEASAFLGSTIKTSLDNDHRKLLLISGVYLGQCVLPTIEHALNLGFDVCVLSDLTTDHKMEAEFTNENLAEIEDKGAAVLQSEQVLEALQIARSAARAPKTKATASPSCR